MSRAFNAGNMRRHGDPAPDYSCLWSCFKRAKGPWAGPKSDSEEVGGGTPLALTPNPDVATLVVPRVYISWPSATLDDVPDEILDEIFDEILEDGQSANATLRSAALVCRRWRGPAQRVLFRHLTFDSPGQEARWFHSLGRTRIRPKTIRINVSRKNDWPSVITAYRGITSLQVRCYIPRAYKTLLSPSFAQLKHLQILVPECVHPGSDPSPPFQLSHLDLGLASNVEPLLLPRLFQGSSTTLEHLTFRNFGLSRPPRDYPGAFTGSHPLDLVGVLTRTAFPSLRHLHIIDGGPHAWLKLLPLIPTLHSLTIANIPPDSLAFLFMSVAMAAPPSLSVLRVWNPARGTGCQHQQSALENDLKDTLSRPTLPNLHLIHLSAWFHRCNAAWGRMEEECRRRSVELVCVPAWWSGHGSLPARRGGALSGNK